MAARVAVISLASDFGCQVQITNMEDHLLDVLGQFELVYWQLASSGHLPADFDVAVIEGAVTTADHVVQLKSIRDTASVVIAIGACAVTGGIPSIAASGDLEKRMDRVYGADGRKVGPGRLTPMPIDEVIEVDYRVSGCPIQPAEFVSTVQRALMGLSDNSPREPLCASCKTAENVCFYDRDTVCLGLVTRAGCGARCVSLGRPCTGCRGIADDANLDSARVVLADHGLAVELLDEALSVYNSLSEVTR